MKSARSVRFICFLALIGAATFACSKKDPAKSELPHEEQRPAGEGGQGGQGGEPGIDERDLGAFSACAEVADDSAAMLEDFENGLGMVAQGGPWVKYDDGSAGEFLWEVVEENKGSLLHITSENFEEFTGFGFDIGSALEDKRSCALDASAFSGVRFKARGKGLLRLRTATVGTLPTMMGGTCTAEGDACYDQPGVFVNLTNEIQTFEVPFCGMRPEGWGVQDPAWHVAELVSLQFVVQSFRQTGKFEIWLDDIELYSKDFEENVKSCGLCPLDQAPVPENINPEQTYLPLSESLTVATFEQATKNCGPLVRRYLSYVPSTLATPSDAPIVIMLHGFGANAESVIDVQTYGRLNELAEEQGFIVVYGNAAPGDASSANPSWGNTGSWRVEPGNDDEVDDVDYLRRVLSDLKKRKLSLGENAIFLAGLSNGGAMTLKAAAEMSAELSGIGVFMPDVSNEGRPIPDLSGGPLSHVLFMYSKGDPGLPPNHDILLPQQPPRWAEALGVTYADPTRIALSNSVEEGADYAGDLSIITRTRNSSVEQIDYGNLESQAMRVFVLDHAGHFLPSPQGDDDFSFPEAWGLRNQDIDASEVMWEFFKTRLEK